MAKFNGIELYEKDGKFGVLVSPEYGAGWSTWNECPALAYDKRVIKFWLKKKDDKEFMKKIDTFTGNDAKIEAKNFMKSIGYSDLYMGGFSDITLQYVEKGVPWRITEDDGYEKLETWDDAGFITF